MKLLPRLAERYSPDSWAPPWTVLEHHARYRFVARFVFRKVVIDLACGCGVAVDYFVRSNPRRIYGFDADERAIATCRNRFNTNERLAFNVANGLQIPVVNELADLFVSLETIEHIDEDRAFIREVARTLKPDGIFICSTPNRLRTNPSSQITDRPWNPYHVREYAPRELIDLISTKFQIQSVHGQNRASKLYSIIINWAARLLGTRFAVKLNQVFKLRWLLFRNEGRYEVALATDIDRYEYIILVCKKRAS